MSDELTKSQRLRQRRREAGLCEGCGKEPPLEGLRTCAICCDRSRVRNSKRHMTSRRSPYEQVQRLRVELAQARWEREAAMAAARELQRQSAPALSAMVERLKADLEDCERELASYTKGAE